MQSLQSQFTIILQGVDAAASCDSISKLLLEVSARPAKAIRSSGCTIYFFNFCKFNVNHHHYIYSYFYENHINFSLV